MGWMQQNLAALGGRSLRQLCIPGSHDSGMSEFEKGTFFARSCNAITQLTGVLGQLQFGVRFFDVRPVIAGGQYRTGHYTFVGDGLGTQGANGQSIASIISDVNTYTAENQELIVLYLSHDLNTDLGQPDYPGFTQEEWSVLLTQLQGLNHLFTADPAADLTLLTLADFIGNGAAVVVIVDTSSDLRLGGLAGQGFYLPTNYQVYNVYSNTSDLSTMQADQLRKLRSIRSNPGAEYFLLSWTLTQSPEQAASCTESQSILTAANVANATLAGMLLPNCSAQTYPNVIYVDGVDSSDFAALSMQVNDIALGTAPEKVQPFYS
jgi:hypothetical protein